MAKRPTLVFVIGSWHSPDCLDKIVEPLRKEGYTCHVPDRPSAADPYNKSGVDDCAAVKAVIRDCVERGENVLVIPHSSGGFVGCDAVQGLLRSERESQGKEGGVVGMAMMAAFIPPVREEGAFKEVPEVDISWWVIDTETNTFIPNDPSHLFYNDLPAEEAAFWTGKIRRVHFGLYADVYQGWRHLPVFYLICEKDNAIRPYVQEGLVKAARAEGGNVKAERMAVGHSPFLVVPKETVDWIQRCVSEVQG